MRWNLVGASLLALGISGAALGQQGPPQREGPPGQQTRDRERLDWDDDACPCPPDTQQTAVRGTGRLEATYGSPQIHVNARGEGIETTGQFHITYPGQGRISGDVTCLNVQGDTAWVVGQVEREQGTLANFDRGDYVIIGIQDRNQPGAQQQLTDLANFSQGLDSEPTCGPSSLANPELPLVEGNFVVRDRAVPPLTS